MAGFYRSGYKSIEGKNKVMVSTQFESLDARRCFPCWDEPAVKAIFEVRACSHLCSFIHRSSSPPPTPARLMPPPLTPPPPKTR